MTPQALIIRTAGTNCDRELAYAFELAGASPQIVHLNQLIADPTALHEADLIGFPGGFSYGDDIAAGRIFANRLRHHLIEPLRAAVQRGVPMIGICNGFQVMVKLGLLPDPHGPDFPSQMATLADNSGGRFVARWVPVEAPDESVCLWTRGLGRFELPVAHGEGRFLPASQAVLDRLARQRQVALRYSSPLGAAGTVDNPNGSVQNIAGVCDPGGTILGLMPHPERYTSPYHHPQWTRHDARWLGGDPPGLRMFRNAVQYVRSRAAMASSA